MGDGHCLWQEGNRSLFPRKKEGTHYRMENGKCFPVKEKKRGGRERRNRAIENPLRLLTKLVRERVGYSLHQVSGKESQGRSLGEKYFSREKESKRRIPYTGKV